MLAASTLSLLGLLQLIWFVCMFFVPFVLIGLGKNMKRLLEINTEMRDIQLKACPDETLTDDQLAIKYGLTRHFDGRYAVGDDSYPTAREAVQVMKRAA